MEQVTEIIFHSGLSNYPLSLERKRLQYPSAKDALLSEVAHIFLTKCGGKHRLGLLTNYLFGIHVHEHGNDGSVQGAPIPETVETLLLHHQTGLSESEVATISEMLEKFMNYSRWYPTIVELPHEMTNYYPKRFEIFLCLLPCVEEVYIFTHDSSCALVMAGVLQNVVKAAKKRALKTVSLAGSSDDDLYSLISVLFTALHYNCADGGM